MEEVTFMNAIIFDVDGTLWDSCQAVANAWNTVFDRYKELNGKKVTAEEAKSFMGKTSEEIFTALLPDIEEQKRIAITEECGKQEEVEISKNGGKLFDNLEKTLQILSQKYDLYIVSNCQAGYIEAFFDYHKLGHYFKDYENSGRTGKPKGENIKLIMQRNNIKKAFYIGDTQGDYNATKIANIPFLYAKYGFGTIDTEVPFIENIEQLPQKADSLFQTM